MNYHRGDTRSFCQLFKRGSVLLKNARGNEIDFIIVGHLSRYVDVIILDDFDIG